MTIDTLSCYLILGPAGSGLTTALNAFNDFGYLQAGEVDPAELEAIIASLGEKHAKLAISVVVPDVTATKKFEETIASLRKAYPGFKVLILDAPEQTLVQRYLDSGKSHRLEGDRDLKGIQQCVAEEKRRFNPLKSLKDYSIDTSTTDKNELHNKVAKILGITVEDQQLTVYITSFGFKYGIPLDSELVFDMRFIKNPFYVDELRPQTGLDAPVCEYIWAQETANTFFKHWSGMIDTMLPAYQQEGKTRLSIGVGCTGGKHRSVCMAEALGKHLKTSFPAYNVVVNHREVFRWASQDIDPASSKASSSNPISKTSTSGER